MFSSGHLPIILILITLLQIIVLYLVLNEIQVRVKSNENYQIQRHQIDEDGSARIADKLSLDVYEDLQVIIKYADDHKFHNVVQFLKWRQSTPARILLDIMGYRARYERSDMLWFLFSMTQYELYPERYSRVDDIAQQLINQPITVVEIFTGGSQMEFLVTFSDGAKAIMKPMRFPRDHVTPNVSIFTDVDRHNAEIAAFHLDRIMGFRTVLPVVGRLVNISSEIFQRLTGPKKNQLQKTFYVSPSKNLCFYGVCHKHCNRLLPVCGNPDMLEVALIPFMPQGKPLHVNKFRNPWKKFHVNYSSNALWMTDDDFCSKIRKIPPYTSDQWLLNVIDTAIFDFLMGNWDRNAYSTFQIFKNKGFIWKWDHGRAFGNPNFDDTSILAPLLQCCLIRASTLQRLLDFNNGPKRLSELMINSTKSDPLFPILTESHLSALDRRVDLVLKSVRECNNRST